MARQKWIQAGFLILVCLWPLYALLSSLSYHLSPSYTSEEALLDDFMEQYPKEKNQDVSGDMYRGEIDEQSFLRKTFIREYPILHDIVKETLTEDVQKQLGRPIRSQADHVKLLDLFRPRITCPSLKRAGNGTTAKWLCGLETFLRKKHVCHIYAFNWNVTDLSFELEVLNKTSCEVHVFDPFLAVEDQLAVNRLHPRILFHNQTLGVAYDRRYLFDELTEDLQSVEEMNLRQITAGLLHRWVDVIKFDYRGEEFAKIAEMVMEWKRAQKKRKRRLAFPVGQLLFELGTGGDAKKIGQAVIPLMNMGFAIFHMDPNLRTQSPWENVAFSFLNLKEDRTFSDDDLVE